MSTLEDLELDMDDNMVDITDFFERPPNEKRSPRPKQTDLQLKDIVPHLKTVPHNVQMNSAAAVVLAKPHRNEIWGILPGQEKSTPWMASMSKKAATQGSIQKIIISM